MPLPQPLRPRLDLLRERLGAPRPAQSDEGEAGLAWAAVAVVLVPSPDAVLLIRRAERPGDPWSGHTALPGGRRAPADADLFETAVRETREEVGLALAPGDLLGGLEDAVPRTPVLPPLAVRPFVFALGSRPPLTPNPEVAGVRWVPIDQLLLLATHQQVRLEIRGEYRHVPAYRLDDGIVWGMTERILTGLLAHLRP